MIFEPALVILEDGEAEPAPRTAARAVAGAVALLSNDEEAADDDVPVALVDVPAGVDDVRAVATERFGAPVGAVASVVELVLGETETLGEEVLGQEIRHEDAMALR